MYPCVSYSTPSTSSFSRILFPEDDPEQKDGFYSGPPEYVTNGDWVRLYHPVTGAVLACSKNRSYVTRKHSLVYAKPVVGEGE